MTITYPLTENGTLVSNFLDNTGTPLSTSQITLQLPVSSRIEHTIQKSVKSFARGYSKRNNVVTETGLVWASGQTDDRGNYIITKYAVAGYLSKTGGTSTGHILTDVEPAGTGNKIFSGRKVYVTSTTGTYNLQYTPGLHTTLFDTRQCESHFVITGIIAEATVAATFAKAQQMREMVLRGGTVLLEWSRFNANITFECIMTRATITDNAGQVGLAEFAIDLTEGIQRVQ